MVKLNNILYKQYELMVHSSLELTKWRQNANKFYLSLNTVLIVVIGYLGDSSLQTSLLVSLVGLTISLLWRQTVSYYRKLNTAKFRVIIDLEKQLPVKIFTEENIYFRKEVRSRKEATRIEQHISTLFGIVYVLLFFYNLYIAGILGF